MAFAYLILWLSSLLSCSSQVSDNARNVFSDDTYDTTFLHLVVNSVSGKVYIGATNRLYQLTESLQPEVSLITGPSNDNPNCPPPTTVCQCPSSDCRDFDKSLMTNVNKYLVVDYRGERLIACSNLFQGHCSRHLTSNITLTDPPASYYTVPNDELSPVVMFVGPGPPNPASTNVLYVASTRSTLGLPAYKDVVPAICMRNLNDLNFVSDDILTPSYIEIEPQQRDLFRVHYVYGFGSLGFSYFLTVQKISAITDSEMYVTKISRICKNDSSLYSYTEVPLECHSIGVHYNILRAAYVTHPGTRLAKSLGLSLTAPLTDMEHILVSVFTSQNNSKYAPVHSALCIYTLHDIRRKFTETILRCFHGTGNTGPDHFVQPKPCFPTPFEIGDDYCGQHDINHPIQGTEPVSRDAVVVWNSTNVTAVTVTTTNESTIAFVGTDNGFIKKVVIDSGGQGREYESIPVEPRISQDLTFDRPREHLYVLTPKKIPVSDCQPYVTCDQCLAARDLYCGWCTLEKSCRKSSECADMQLANRWLSTYSVPQAVCPTIDSTPSYADITRDLSVTVTITSLPELKSGEYYSCVFGSRGSTSRASVVGSQLICPMTQNKPQIPSSDDSIAVVLSIQMSSSSTDFIQTNFTFYDCNRHLVCSSCLSTPLSFRWCIFANKCQNETLSCLYNSSVEDKQFCPRLVPDSKEILIPSGIESSITLIANNLPVPQANDRGYSCEISSSGQSKLLVTARRVNSGLITCTPYSYHSSDAQPYSSSVRLVWGNGGFLIEGSYNATVFNCSAMTDGDCNRCLSLQYHMSIAKYGCQWCDSVCRPNVSQCASLPSDQTRCPRATVTYIVPQSGPKEGGTLVTVTGTNLGYGFDRVAVLIGNVSCQGYPEQYVISQRYVCVTPSTRSSGDHSLTVVVSYEAGSLDSRTYNFIYKEPQVYDIKPAFGPQAGGTPVTLLGKDLDTGSNTSIFIGQQPCILDRLKSNDSQIVCNTTGSNVSNFLTDVRLQIDNASSHINKVFNYTENPIISMPIPKGSFKRGGCTVSIPVSRLDSVANIDLVFQSGNNAIPVEVTFRNSSVFQFLSPGIHEDVYSDITYQLVMQLDGIRKQLPFTIYPDSLVQLFDKDWLQMKMICPESTLWSVTTTLRDGIGTDSSNNYWFFVSLSMVAVVSIFLVLIGIMCLIVYIRRRRISTGREDPVHESNFASLDRPMSDEYEIMPYAYTDGYDKIDDIIETDLDGPIQFPRREGPLPTPGYDNLLPRPSTPTVYSVIDNYDQPMYSEDIEISPGHIPEAEHYSDTIEHSVTVNAKHPAYTQMIGDEQLVESEEIEIEISPGHTPKSEQYSDMDKSFAVEHGVKVNAKHPAYLQLINDEQPMSGEKIEKSPGHTPEARQYSDTIEHSVNVNTKDPAYIQLISEGEDSSPTFSAVSVAREEINRSSITSSNSVDEIPSSYLKINEDTRKDDSSEEIPPT